MEMTHGGQHNRFRRSSSPGWELQYTICNLRTRGLIWVGSGVGGGMITMRGRSMPLHLWRWSSMLSRRCFIAGGTRTALAAASSDPKQSATAPAPPPPPAVTMMTTTTATMRTRSPPSTPLLAPALAYRYLGLQNFSREELDHVFDSIRGSKPPPPPAARSSVLQDQPGEQQQDQQQQRQHLGDASTTTSSSSSSLAQDKDDDTAIDTTHIQYYLQSERIPVLEEEGHRDKGWTIAESPDTDQRRRTFCQVEADRIVQLLQPLRLPSDNYNRGNVNDDNNTQAGAAAAVAITRQQFADSIMKQASQVDLRQTWPIAVSMLLVGTSVGVMTPAMPFMVEELALTTSQYGMVVSSFALAKMLGNIPSAILVERHGRKPYMTYSLGIVAASVAGIGLATSFPELCLCRLMTGFCVAAMSTSSTMMITDLSNPLNRASTIAPIMSAFAAGTALGPAVGGILVDQVGLHQTFYVVGLGFLGVSLLNRVMLAETQASALKFDWQQTVKVESTSSQKNESWSSAVYDAVNQWVPLLKDPDVRSVIVMNGFYWVALAGAQLTLLPLMLTDSNGLAMTATQVGQVYMGMSTIQIVGNPLFARLVDRVGKAPAIVGGCTLIGSAMMALPLCHDYTQLAAVLGIWSVGSSMLSTAPLAYISDQVSPNKRAQAIALLRTSGDVGFLLGASGAGALADYLGSLQLAVQSSAAILMAATAWFTARQLLSRSLTQALTATDEETTAKRKL